MKNVRPQKKFKLAKEQIKPLVLNRGACIATDQITVVGLSVGFMRRTKSINSRDSGWQFFSGNETQEFLDEPSNSTIYDVNTIAKYDPEIIPLLDAPVGSAFERSGPEQPLLPVEDAGDPE